MKKTALVALPFALLVAVSATACSADDPTPAGTGTPAATSEVVRPGDAAAQTLHDQLVAQLPHADATVYHGTVTVTTTATDSADVVAFLEQTTKMPVEVAQQVAEATGPSTVTYGQWLVGVTPSDDGGAVWKLTSLVPSR